MKLYPGGTGHCVVCAGPSDSDVPRWSMPWKCKLVVSFPSLLLMWTTTWSLTVAFMGGQGHCPLIPVNVSQYFLRLFGLQNDLSTDDTTSKSIWRRINPCNVPAVLHGFCEAVGGESRQENN